MAIDFSLAKVPVSTTAPMSGGLQMAMGMQEGAKAGVAGPLAQAQLQTAQSQGVLAQAEAAQAPQMAQMKEAMMSGAIKASDLENHMKMYTMAQNMLAPSAMALSSGDEASAKSIYDSNIVALKKAGIDPASVGAPEQYDPAFVKSAFSNAQQQMAMAKQMLQMAQMQGDISKNASTENRNNAEVQKIGYETGLPVGGGGAFTGLGGGAQVGSAGNLTPKGQSEVNIAQAKQAIQARAALGPQANAARSTVTAAQEGLDILDKNPNAAGRPGIITQFTNPDINRLASVYDQLKLAKIGTDYANQGLGPLDVVVANALFNTTASISEPYVNQKVKLQNTLVAGKSILLANELAAKLSSAGVYDENQRAQIGAQIMAKLNIKQGSKITLSNFDNSESVINSVLSKNGIPTTEAAAKNQGPIPEHIATQLNNLGLTPQEQQEYLASKPQKQQ